MIPVLVGAIGAVGAGLCVAGAFLDPRAAGAGWLVAAWATTGIALGAVTLGCLSALAPMPWLSALRPATDRLAGLARFAPLLLLPVVLAAPSLYPWLAPEGQPAPAREAIAHRGAWMAAGFVLVRGVAYVAIWIALAHRVRRLPPDGNARGPAAAMLAAVGLTWTLASFDLVQSLEANRSSTIDGFYAFSGGTSAALAATLLLSWASQRDGTLPRLPPDVTHALARLLFAFTMLWAYAFWAGTLITWIADIPEEAAHLAPRLGPWGAWLVVLLVCHFALPFVALLGRAPKRSLDFSAAVAALVVLAHGLDCAWVILPGPYPDRPTTSMYALGPCLLAVAFALASVRSRGSVAEPLLGPSLAYRSR